MNLDTSNLTDAEMYAAAAGTGPARIGQYQAVAKAQHAKTLRGVVAMLRDRASIYSGPRIGEELRGMADELEAILDAAKETGK